ncbi:MAG: Arc family DNA-binding protein [Clostridiales bacterium]|nr:Arc family DNA-binding protein [Clostridiales bacterium]
MPNNNDPYTKDGDSRFTLRLPTELLDIIRNEAKKNKRSTGKQIEFILEEWLSENKPKE